MPGSPKWSLSLKFPTKTLHTRFLLPIRPTCSAHQFARIAGSKPPGTWMSVSYECCVLSGKGLCDGLITHPEEFY